MTNEQPTAEQGSATSEDATQADNLELNEQEAEQESELDTDLENDDMEEDLALELSKAQATIKDYWEQIVRLNADIENNRKRAQRDVENAHKFAVKNFVESLLPVADSMEMGLNATEAENVNLDSIKEGIAMTHELFITTLQKNGIKAVDPTGEKFDPDLHQAMSMQESDEVEPNTVMAVMQKGYLLNERLIRPAMVVVSKAKS
jgi:molecular chaperone GrpE